MDKLIYQLPVIACGEEGGEEEGERPAEAFVAVYLKAYQYEQNDKLIGDKVSDKNTNAKGEQPEPGREEASQVTESEDLAHQ